MTAILGEKKIILSEVDSTNNYAMQRCMSEMWDEGTVVIAKCQSKGRGQVANTWESEPFKNITLSIVLKPNFISPVSQFMLSKIVSLGIADTVSAYVSNVAIKWPNDIYVDNKKIAGILIENIIMGSVVEYSVVGIGLNVNQSVFNGDAPNPISLFQLIKKEVEIDDIERLLIKNIEKWYALLMTNNLEMINDQFLNCLYKFDVVSKFSDKNGTFNGKIVGVSPIGLLRIELENGAVNEYQFKQVRYIL